MRVSTGSSTSKPTSSRTSRRKPSCSLPLLETATGGDPGVAPTGRGNMTDQEDATPPVTEESTRGPERILCRPERRVVRWDDEFPFLDRDPSESVERIRESVLAHS